MNWPSRRTKSICNGVMGCPGKNGRARPVVAVIGWTSFGMTSVYSGIADEQSFVREGRAPPRHRGWMRLHPTRCLAKVKYKNCGSQFQVRFCLVAKMEDCVCLARASVWLGLALAGIFLGRDGAHALPSWDRRWWGRSPDPPAVLVGTEPGPSRHYSLIDQDSVHSFGTWGSESICDAKTIS